MSAQPSNAPTRPPRGDDEPGSTPTGPSAPATVRDDVDLEWYDDLLRAGRSEPERIPWYRRIFSRSSRDRRDAPPSPTRRLAARRAHTPAPATPTTASHSARPGTLSTVMGLVVVSGLALIVGPGTAVDVGPRPDAAVAAPDGGEAAVPDPGSTEPLSAAPERAAAPPRVADDQTPSPTTAGAIPIGEPTEDRSWLAVVERLDSDEVTRADAEDRSMTLTILGLASEVVSSEDLGEEPGSWAIVTGPFGTADQAVASCADRDAAEMCEPIRPPG